MIAFVRASKSHCALLICIIFSSFSRLCKSAKSILLDKIGGGLYTEVALYVSDELVLNWAYIELSLQSLTHKNDEKMMHISKAQCDLLARTNDHRDQT